MRKFYLKTLFLACTMLMSVSSAWADETIGSTTTGWSSASTSAYTLPTGKTLTFTFTIDETGGNWWEGYVAILAKTQYNTWGSDNHYVFLRANCDYITGKNEDTNTWSDGALYNANTYGDVTKVDFYTGATVTLTIKRVGKIVFINTAITKDATTYYHYYQQNLDTTDDVYAFLAADYAQMTISGDAITDNGLTEESYDFVSARGSSNVGCETTGWINVNKTSSNIISNTQIEMNDRFAAQFGSGSWMIHKNNALYSVNSGARRFAVLNLKAGDLVAITFPSDKVPSFTGTPNAYISTDGDVSDGTALVSGVYYTIKNDGMFALSAPNYAIIESVDILTSAPVLNKPTITYIGLGESDGLYYTQVSITSADEGVTFYNESNEVVTSPYTITSAGTLKIYAAKEGRTKSVKTSYTSDGSSYILANSVNTNSLTLSDFSSNGGGSAGSPYNYYLLTNDNSDNTTAIPGLRFYNNNQNCWGIVYQGTSIQQIQNRRNASRSIACTILNEDRIASLTRQGGGTDWLNNTTNWASFAQYAGINNYKLFTKSDATVSVTIGSTGYSTFSCPVPLDFSGVSGLTAYVATNHNSEYVTLKSIETAPANTGLVLKGTPSTGYSIPVTASPSTPETNYMVGCIVETSVATNLNYYVLVNNEGTAEFQRLDVNGATIPAGKAYLNVPSAGANLRISFDADETTGIKVVEGSESRTEIYNLSGQRVINPTKGLYIMNGKKVFIK